MHTFKKLLYGGMLGLTLCSAPFSASAKKPEKAPPAKANAGTLPAGAPEASPPPEDEEDPGTGEPGALLRVLNRLDLSKEQRLKIHGIVDQADDERIRLGRKVQVAGDEVKKLAKEKLPAVFSDDRKARITTILDEELAAAKEERRDRRSARRGSRRGGEEGPLALEAFQRLKDRVFDEVKMNDPEAEKMLAAFGDVKKAAHEKAEKFREEFKKLRDQSKAKIMTILTDDQRKEFEAAIEKLKGRRKRP